MIIFILALVVLVISLVVNFLPSLNKNKVLIMSVLAILMIMINFINEVDIVVSPPQLLVKVDSPMESHGKKELVKLNFKPDFDTSKMVYFNKELNQLKQQITSSNQLIDDQKKTSLQQIATLSLPNHLKPITKSQFYLIQQLKSKLISGQDWIVNIQGIDKIRFELLMGFYLKNVNEKANGYGHQFEKILNVAIYDETMTGEKGFKFTQKLNDKNYYYIVVYDQPTEKLLNFLYDQYTSLQQLTVIFLDLNQKVNIFPISQLIQHITYPEQNYLQPITDYLLQSIQTKDKKESREMVNKLEKELEICEKYVDMDFQFFLKIQVNKGHKTLTKICYEEIIEPIGDQLECLRNLLSNEDEQLPYFKAKKCLKGKYLPYGVIKTSNDKIRLKKQHFWSNKVTPADFGLEVITKKCSNQL